jgi:CRISPR-associated protein Csm5
MNYRLTALTPLLVGDGQTLSPIDYMVWKDQVNVLDQRRIFKLLAKGPRLDGYLSQLRRAEKLDFASWGGFAQNFAGRRIPFEHPGSSQIWDRTRAEYLHIPTFAASVQGPYLPASALKGALRTAFVYSLWQERGIGPLSQLMETKLSGDRPSRQPALAAEEPSLGSAGTSKMRVVNASDSAPVPVSVMKVYLTRTATLVPRGGAFETAWKVAPRGSSPKPDDALPVFAEMAVPGTAFEGRWSENEFLKSEGIASQLRWRHNFHAGRLLVAANQWAAAELKLQLAYAQQAKLPALAAQLEALEQRRAALGENACFVHLGWGGGYWSKGAALPGTDEETESLRKVLRLLPYYNRAIQTGLPFPKTRRIVYQGGQPAALPGWALLEIQ